MNEVDITNEKLAELLFEAAYTAWTLNVVHLKLSLFQHLNDPEIGDYVIEITNPHVPRLRAVGKLVEQKSLGVYVIECLDGKRHEWENAKFVKVPNKTTRKFLRG